MPVKNLVALVVTLLGALLLLAPRVAHADAAAPPTTGAPTIVLYSVAPGSELFSLYGHSVLCVEQGEPDPTCYDYGVAQADGAMDLIWGSIRGRALFVPTTVARSVMTKSFEDEERSIWKQTIPLAPEDATALAEKLRAEAEAKRGYVYDPRFANCTTKLRDAIDRAANGKLHAGMDVPHPGPTFRRMWEEGLSGQVLPLAATELFFGADVDRAPTAWERLLLPAELREAVAKQLGAEPVSVYAAHAAATVKTSPSAGRVVLVLLGIALAVALFVGGRRGGRAAKVTSAVALGTLSLLGVLVWALAATSAYTELRMNAALLVLVPIDLSLQRLHPKVARRYLEARLGVIGLVVLLSLAGVVRPLLSLAILAGLPLGVAYVLTRRAVPPL